MAPDCLMGTKSPLGGNENVLKLDKGGGHIILQMY